MELYEIIKVKLIPLGGHAVEAKPSIITAVMDEDVAYKMLEIYKANQKADETYQVRTVRMPKAMEW